MDEEPFNSGGQRVGQGQPAQFRKQCLCPAYWPDRLDDHHRRLPAPSAEAHQGGAAHLRMFVEDRLADHGVEHTVGGAHPVRLAAAEPEPPCVVQVAHVTHAVPESVIVRDLGQQVFAFVAVIGAGDHRSANRDLADLADRQFADTVPGFDRPIHRLDHPHRHPRQGPAHAGAVPGAGQRPGLTHDFPPLQAGDRQTFGGPVGGVDQCLRRQDALHSFDQFARHRRPGHEHLAHRQDKGALQAIPADHVPDGRRAEGVGHPVVQQGADEFLRVDLGWPGRVHVRDHRPGAEGCGEQAEQRKTRLVNVSRADAVVVANQLQLGVEDAVGVLHALGRTGGAGGEDDRGQVVHSGRDSLRHSTAGTGQSGRGEPSGDHDAPTHRGKGRTKQVTEPHRRRDTDQDVRPDRTDTAQQVAVAHTRVDEDDHRAQPEQGEGQADKGQRRPHHEHYPVAAAHTPGLEQPGEPLAAGQQVAKTPFLPGPGLPGDQGNLVLLADGHPAQGMGDVVIGHGAGTVVARNRSISGRPSARASSST